MRWLNGIIDPMGKNYLGFIDFASYKGSSRTSSQLPARCRKPLLIVLVTGSQLLPEHFLCKRIQFIPLPGSSNYLYSNTYRILLLKFSMYQAYCNLQFFKHSFYVVILDHNNLINAKSNACSLISLLDFCIILHHYPLYPS